MTIKLGQGLRRDAGGNVPQVEAPAGRLVQIPPGSSGQQEAAALEQTGQDVQDIANAQITKDLQAQAAGPIENPVEMGNSFENVIKTLCRAIPNIGVLVVINALFFALSFVAFVRYDVRSE